MIDWEAIRDTIDSEARAAELVTSIREQPSRFIETYNDEADRTMGWFHDYNCPDCAARLTFDLERPHEHTCPACGKVSTNEKLDRAWYNTYRGRANATVYNAAILHRLESDPRYIDFILTVLDFYSDHYDEFVPAPPAKGFEGKIMNHHLDDAVGMITIPLGLDFVRDEIGWEPLQSYYDRLFVKEAESFDFFATQIYNIPVWIKCAQAMIGMFFGSKKQINSAFCEKYGILDRLARGVRAEGLWYEGSMHYHFYTLQPVCYLLFMFRTHQSDIPEIDRIYETVEKMVEYPLKMIFRDRSFPNPNDAHPSLSIDNYVTQYEYASAIFDNALIRDVCGTFYRGEGTGTLARLLFNRQPTRGAPNSDEEFATRANTQVTLPDFRSINNPESYTAMVKTDHTELFIKYGLHTYLHAHPDTMNIEFAFDGDRVAYDLGNGGYASFLFSEWQRKSIAHNTVVIDMKDHRNLTDGIVRRFDRDANLLEVSAKGVYEAANFTRTVRVEDYRIEDSFRVDARGEYTMDWLFYCEGEAKCEYDTEPVEKLGEEEGYQHLFDVRRFAIEGDWFVDFTLSDKTVRVEMAGLPGTEVYLVKSYTDSTEHVREGLKVRRRCEKTTFATRYLCIPK